MSEANFRAAEDPLHHAMCNLRWSSCYDRLGQLCHGVFWFQQDEEEIVDAEAEVGTSVTTTTFGTFPEVSILESFLTVIF